MADPLVAWNAFREAYLLEHAPAGQDRYRSVLQAAMNVYNLKHGLPKVQIPTIAFNNKRIKFLDHEQRDKLIECYVPHVRPIITMMAFQGPRTQEALQVRWGINGVDLERETIFFERTKSGEPRTVAMHPRVKKVLLPIWKERGRTGQHVFLNQHGVPYQDNRPAKRLRLRLLARLDLVQAADEQQVGELLHAR